MTAAGLPRSDPGITITAPATSFQVDQFLLLPIMHLMFGPRPASLIDERTATGGLCRCDGAWQSSRGWLWTFLMTLIVLFVLFSLAQVRMAGSR